MESTKLSMEILSMEIWSMVSRSSIRKGSKSRGDSPSSVEDSCAEVCSSKAGGEGRTGVDSVTVAAIAFLPAGRTAAKASIPLATFRGRVGPLTVGLEVTSGDECGLGDEDLN